MTIDEIIGWSNYGADVCDDRGQLRSFDRWRGGEIGVYWSLIPLREGSPGKKAAPR